MTTAGNALVVMTKAPEPGQSKTRLVPPLSYGEAADLARALLLDQLNNLTHFSEAEMHIAFAPAEAKDALAALAPAGFGQFPQSGGDLGERMANAFRHLFARGFARVVLIGGDLPALPLAIFSEAFAALHSPSPQVVLGPKRRWRLLFSRYESSDAGDFFGDYLEPGRCLRADRRENHDLVKYLSNGSHLGMI